MSPAGERVFSARGAWGLSTEVKTGDLEAIKNKTQGFCCFLLTGSCYVVQAVLNSSFNVWN